MEYSAYVHEVERESARVADALGSGDLDVTVPACPDWTLRDLARHLGDFNGFWAHVLCEAGDRPKSPFPTMPEDQAVAGWYADLAGHLLTELRNTLPDATVWTWCPEDQTARFIARRCANELSIHRVDAQLARGFTDSIDPELAVDGIEEIFMMAEVWRRQGHPDTGCGNGETFHLHALDRDNEWLLTLTPDGLRVSPGNADADLALRGAAEDLELTLYQRPERGNVEWTGDPSVLSAWYRAFTFG